eukprot:PLAT11244.1.p1 GENE.PLAT11244.1~~PLAT11244.1.p1  ORF type:complete len:506 (-),score=204.46 PLAT11244.1:1212-2729(-)
MKRRTASAADGDSKPPSAMKIDKVELVAKVEAGGSGMRPTIYTNAPLPRPSLLEQTEWRQMDPMKSGKFEGAVYCCMLLLCFVLASLAWDAHMAGGVPGKLLRQWSCLFDQTVDAAIVCAGLLACTGPLYFFHRLWAVDLVGHGVVTAVYLLLQAFLLFGGTWFLRAMPVSPMIGIMTGMWLIVLLFKCHSYWATNWLLSSMSKTVASGAASEREEPAATPPASPSSSAAAAVPGSPRPSPATVEAAEAAGSTYTPPEYAVATFPHNINLTDFVFFMGGAPTLVYETSYPRNPRVRWVPLATHWASALLSFVLVNLLLEEVLVPILRSERDPVSKLLALATPSFIMWVTMFYGIFHAMLNGWAEAMRFADRQFYLDFWNSRSLRSFWRKWNVPVHEFFLRHVFVDGVRFGGMSRMAAMFAVFFVSALIHEMVFFIAFKVLRPWLFLGMLAQPVMIVIDKAAFSIHGSATLGNVLMWLNLVIGQPLMELGYFGAYFQTHSDLYCPE